MVNVSMIQMSGGSRLQPGSKLQLYIALQQHCSRKGGQPIHIANNGEMKELGLLGVHLPGMKSSSPSATLVRDPPSTTHPTRTGSMQVISDFSAIIIL